MAAMSLQGVRVIEFGPLIAMPMTGRILGALGAEVIKVETNRALDEVSYIPGWSPGIGQPELQMCKRRITLDPRRPGAKRIWEELLKISDVFMTNFRRRVLEGWGIDFPAIKQINPDIITLWQTGAGSIGPYGDYKLYGMFTQHLCGISLMTGFPGPVPGVANTSYSDYHCAVFQPLAVIGALERRRRTGQPAFIECSVLKSGAVTVGPAALDFMANNRLPERIGNRHPFAAPHGVYPCQGDDRWCAIAVFTQEEWQAFCRVIGNPEWVGEPRFATLLGRLRNADELDRLVADWTVRHSAEEVMDGMQRGGVAAGIVSRGQDLSESEHLRQRGMFSETVCYVPDREKPGIDWEVGPAAVGSRVPIGLSETPCRLTPMRRPGDDNDYVYGELLGMPREEIERLAEEKVIF